MEEEANVQIKKGQRKSKKEVVTDPEPSIVAEEEAPKKATKAKKKVETEDYDVEQQPDIILHKRHKGAKPRKIIVITGDSSGNESDEELPYRARPKIQVKARPKKAPVVEAESESEAEPVVKKKKAKVHEVPVQKISQKPNADIGAGLPERYAMTNKPKTGYVVDEYIDALLGLS